MQSVQKAVDSFREAALLPQRWPDALQSIAVGLFSEGATIVLKDGSDDGIVCSHTVCPVLPDYRRMPYSDLRRNIRLRPDEGFVPDYAHFSRSEIAVDPYYQEFLIPRGLGCHAVASLLPGLDISLKRSTRRGHYNDVELTQLNKVLPSLRSASRMAKLSWQSRFSGQLSAFERLGRGALLLDRQGRVLETNRCVRFGDGLDFAHGVLTLSRQSDRQRLERYLTAVLHPHQGHLVSDDTTLVVARPSGRRPWVIDGISSTDALRSLHSDAAAVLLITDLEQSRDSGSTKLMQVFGLTVRESELALQIAAGRPLKSVAGKLGITEQHARQRLKDIYKKTKCSGQGDLIAVLSRL
jgi:DNA-binding CsgD family transcriptional regulator